MFLTYKNGEPRFLVRSYWDKVAKKNRQEKFYVFKWLGRNIRKLERMVKLRVEVMGKQNIGDRTKNYVNKCKKLEDFYQNQKKIDSFVQATNKEINLKRVRVDRRRTRLSTKKRKDSEVNFYNMLLRHFNNKRMQTTLIALVNDPNFGPVKTWPQKRKELVRDELESTKKFIDKFWNDLM